MLALAPMGDEDNLTGEEHCAFLQFVLSIYDRNIEFLVAMTGDNENTKHALPRRIVIFIDSILLRVKYMMTLMKLYEIFML